jgi:hypothetical protein
MRDVQATALGRLPTVLSRQLFSDSIWYADGSVREDAAVCKSISTVPCLHGTQDNTVALPYQTARGHHGASRPSWFNADYLTSESSISESSSKIDDQVCAKRQ